MAFDFSGFVLRAPRVAPTNAATTAEPLGGVVRALTTFINFSAPMPDPVDLAADQYRAAVLEAPGTTTTEYLVWAYNTSQGGTVCGWQFLHYEEDAHDRLRAFVEKADSVEA